MMMWLGATLVLASQEAWTRQYAELGVHTTARKGMLLLPLFTVLGHRTLVSFSP